MKRRRPTNPAETPRYAAPFDGGACPDLVEGLMASGRRAIEGWGDHQQRRDARFQWVIAVAKGAAH